jgi:hypothetical protein
VEDKGIKRGELATSLAEKYRLGGQKRKMTTDATSQVV